MPGNPSRTRTVQRRTLRRLKSRCRGRSRRGGSWMTIASRSTWTTSSLRMMSQRPNCRSCSRWLMPGSSKGRKRKIRRERGHMPPSGLHEPSGRNTCMQNKNSNGPMVHKRPFPLLPLPQDRSSRIRLQIPNYISVSVLHVAASNCKRVRIGSLRDIFANPFACRLGG